MAASMTEQTLAIIKPDAIMAGKQAEILDMIGKNAFTLVSQDLVLLTPERAKAFYAEHDGKAFFEGLTDFMCSGPHNSGPRVSGQSRKKEILKKRFDL